MRRGCSDRQASPPLPPARRRSCTGRRSAAIAALPPRLTRRDEENLEENERIKKELNPRKISAYSAGGAAAGHARTSGRV